LYENYLPYLDSNIADINNSVLNNNGGQATLAALFLQKFVDDKDIPWAHFDIRAWNPKTLPGRPEGAEAMGLRAVYQLIKTRFSK
jgi:leucyl aminopeptidase